MDDQHLPAFPRGDQEAHEGGMKGMGGGEVEGAVQGRDTLTGRDPKHINNHSTVFSSASLVFFSFFLHFRLCNFRLFCLFFSFRLSPPFFFVISYSVFLPLLCIFSPLLSFLLHPFCVYFLLSCFLYSIFLLYILLSFLFSSLLISPFVCSFSSTLNVPSL